MKKNMDIYSLAEIVQDMIKAGDDFIVGTYDFGMRLRLPITKDDVMPRVKDFENAGADLALISVYFAYLICAPGYQVYSVQKGKNLQADVTPTLKDQKLINLFEEKFLDKAQNCKSERLAKDKNEESRM